MLIYRVGHKSQEDGVMPQGPYCNRWSLGLSEELLEGLHNMAWKHSDDTHPNPYVDPLLNGIRTAERCGFDSLEALHEWFKGYFELLVECGFLLYAYDVPDGCVRVGMFGQAVFIGSAATQIRVSDFDLNYTVGKAA
ncbi:hypothetical protein [Nonomuraea jabiensis]|uniref:hypothetical protein n=1 Tax=Nonomuraea jabiensis TaxID=882448 RepID=UPI003D746216